VVNISLGKVFIAKKHRIAIPDLDGNSIMECTRSLDFDNFKSDTKTVDAVVRNLEIIGGAAAHSVEGPMLLRDQTT
jgi:hypothetical protein